MRGTFPLIALATVLLIAAPVSAAEEAVSLDDAHDLVDVEDLLQYRAFELLLFPGGLLDQLGTPLSTELPGPTHDLQPNLNLLIHQPGALDLPVRLDRLALPALYADETSTTTDATVATGQTLTDGASAASDASSSDTAAISDGSSQASDDPSTSQDETLATQGTQAPAAGDGLQQAWQALSPAAKTALVAGSLAVFLLGPLAAMYSRIRRDETLENDTRRNIYEIVQARPGICIKDVADEADVSYSTASYHLDRLVRTDYLVSSEQGNKVLYYKNGGTFTPDERDLVPILKNEECMRVFEQILEHPWCYRAEVAQALGVSHTTVNWHLKRLLDAELVEEHREGRNCHLYIGQQALDRVAGVLDKLETLGATEEVAFQPAPVPA